MLVTPSRRLRQWLFIWYSPGPAERLILRTVRQQWRLLAVNVITSLLEAFSEGAALAVVFMAVQVLSSTGHFNVASNPLMVRLPLLVDLLHDLPRVPLFLLLLAVSVLLQLLQSGSRYMNALSVGYLAARCRAQITARIHSQILSFTYACASRYRVGDLADLLSLGPDAVRVAIEQNSQLLVNGLLIAVYLAVLLALSPWLLLMAILLALLIAWVQRRLLPRIRRAALQVSGDQRLIAAQVTEHIQGLRLLHSLGQLEAADRLLLGQMDQIEKSLQRQYQLMELIGPISQLLPVLSIAVLGSASLLVFGDSSSGILPGLVTFVLALQRLNMRFSMIARVYTELSANAGRLNRLDTLLEFNNKQFRRIGGTPFAGLQQLIRLEDVDLIYPESDKKTLKNINFSMEKGQMVALVGASGAGKSSIADLLVGLYEPSGGRILIDGLDLATIDLASWQQRLGVVSQDTFLFNASIADNISFGCPWASNRHVEAAAAAAQASGFINNLPNGYSTLIGERGFRLSGGQRQRLSLARAILRQPDLLILDEATSALDSRLEEELTRAVANMNQGVTRLVIAHRLSTVVHADMIIVIDAGKVVQQGRHKQLLEDANGIYRSLWLTQSNSQHSFA